MIVKTENQSNFAGPKYSGLIDMELSSTALKYCWCNLVVCYSLRNHCLLAPMLDANSVDWKHVSVRENVADILTKKLARILNEYHTLSFRMKIVAPEIASECRYVLVGLHVILWFIAFSRFQNSIRMAVAWIFLALYKNITGWYPYSSQARHALNWTG